MEKQKKPRESTDLAEYIFLGTNNFAQLQIVKKLQLLEVGWFSKKNYFFHTFVSKTMENESNLILGLNYVKKSEIWAQPFRARRWPGGSGLIPIGIELNTPDYRAAQFGYQYYLVQ